MNWYAIYVRSRFEKKVERCLKARHLDSFLPVIKEVRQWSDRKKKVDVPLFAGYLFVRIDLNDRVEILQIDGVVKFVGPNDRPSIVPEEQVKWVRILGGHSETLLHEPYVTVGDTVLVTGGPFRGLCGQVQRRKGPTRVIITLESITQSVSVEVRPEFLKSLDE